MVASLDSCRSDEQQCFRQAAWTTTRKTATSTKLRPRDGVTPAWQEELMDIEAARGYNKLRDAPCPDIVDTMRQLEGASVDLDTVRHVHQLVVNEYWVENTQYYETLRASRLDRPLW